MKSAGVFGSLLAVASVIAIASAQTIGPSVITCNHAGCGTGPDGQQPWNPTVGTCPSGTFCCYKIRCSDHLIWPLVCCSGGVTTQCRTGFDSLGEPFSWCEEEGSD